MLILLFTKANIMLFLDKIVIPNNLFIILKNSPNSNKSHYKFKHRSLMVNLFLALLTDYRVFLSNITDICETLLKCSISNGIKCLQHENMFT